MTFIIYLKVGHVITTQSTYAVLMLIVLIATDKRYLISNLSLLAHQTLSQSLMRRINGLNRFGNVPFAA